MTTGELNTSTNGDDGIEPEDDPWSEVVGRLGAGPDRKRESESEPVPRGETESGCPGQGGSAPSKRFLQHRFARIALVVTPCVLVVVLLWITLPLVGSSDPMRSSPRSAPQAKGRPAPRQARDRPSVWAQRTRRERAKAKVRVGGDRSRHREHGEPVKAETLSSPSDPAPPRSAPAVAESAPMPVPPPAPQPGDKRGGLVDGARDSAEFGL